MFVYYALFKKHWVLYYMSPSEFSDAFIDSYIQGIPNWCIHTLKHYFSVIEWDKNNNFYVIFLKLPYGSTCSKWPPSATVHSQQWHWTEWHTIWIITNGISLMACSILFPSSSSVCGFMAYTMFFKVPQR